APERQKNAAGFQPVSLRVSSLNCIESHFPIYLSTHKRFGSDWRDISYLNVFSRHHFVNRLHTLYKPEGHDSVLRESLLPTPNPLPTRENKLFNLSVIFPDFDKPVPILSADAAQAPAPVPAPASSPAA